MVGQHHQLSGHEFEQTPGDSERKGSLAVAVHGITKGQTQLSDWKTTAKSQAVSVIHNDLGCFLSGTFKKKKQLFILYWGIAD